jgi:hypothetical protein
MSAVSCIKTFTLEVIDSVCGLWAIAWDAPVLTPSVPAGTLSADQTACHILTSASVPGNCTFGSQIQGHGSFFYTGDLVSCHLHVDTVVVGTPSFTIFTLQVKVDSVLVLDVFINSGGGGVFDYDWDLPLSVGALIEVDYVCALFENDAGPGCSQTFDVTFSVNP